MTVFNTLSFLNDEISSFSFFCFESDPSVSYTTLRSTAVSRSNNVFNRQYEDGEINESLQVVTEKLQVIMIRNRQQKKITDYYNL